MELNKVKALSAKTLGVGKGRIVLNTSRLADIREALTKQDIRDLFADGSIMIAEIKGRTAKYSRRTRRRAGSIKMKPGNKKKLYIVITRKLRTYLSELRKQNKLTNEQFFKLRREIRARAFKTKAHLKERLAMKEKK